MAYEINQIATAADINVFIDTMRNVYEVGNGDFGYGQDGGEDVPSPMINAVQGELIRGHVVERLRNALYWSLNHLGGSTAQLPPPEVFNEGEIMRAYESSPPTSSVYDFNSLIDWVVANRLNPASSSMSLLSNVWTNTRSTQWGEAIYCHVHVNFSSEDAARHFFNTGGQIRISMTQPGSSPQDTDWRNTLTNKVGVFTFQAHSCQRSGSAGTLLNNGNAGYYELTDSYQYYYNGQNIGDGLYYSANDVTIQVQRLNYAGVRGGNGRTIRFRVALIDSHTNPWSDVVSAGTQINVSIYKATYLKNIETPNFDGSLGWDFGT